MILKGATTNLACAACKYQRKRCTLECPLAPHFRPEHPAVFRNAHKLFGVRNILRILEQINPNHKTEAMRSIIYEANMRDQFPAHGCLKANCDLRCQIRQVEEELYSVLTMLAFYKQHHERQLVTVLSRDVDHGRLLQPDNDEHVLSKHDVLATTLPVSSGDNANVCANAFCFQETCKSSKTNHKSLECRPLIIEEGMHDQDEISPFFNNTED